MHLPQRERQTSCFCCCCSPPSYQIWQNSAFLSEKSGAKASASLAAETEQTEQQQSLAFPRPTASARRRRRSGRPGQILRVSELPEPRPVECGSCWCRLERLQWCGATEQVGTTRLNRANRQTVITWRHQLHHQHGAHQKRKREKRRENKGKRKKRRKKPTGKL